MNRYKQLSQLPGDLVYSTMNSPVGTLIILASSWALYMILWQDELNDPHIANTLKRFSVDDDHQLIQQSKKQLQEYFTQQRQIFDLPLAPIGTDFQLSAWQQLSQIPYGETISYGEQAQRVGNKNKARAVGAANGSNPIPIVVPCHRVIGSNGELTGFAGGMNNKEYLLNLEKAVVT